MLSPTCAGLAELTGNCSLLSLEFVRVLHVTAKRICLKLSVKLYLLEFVWFDIFQHFHLHEYVLSSNMQHIYIVNYWSSIYLLIICLLRKDNWQTTKITYYYLITLLPAFNLRNKNAKRNNSSTYMGGNCRTNMFMCMYLRSQDEWNCSGCSLLQLTVWVVTFWSVQYPSSQAMV